MLDRLEKKLSAFLNRRRHDRLVRRFGGIQQCPWCRQCAQDGDGWNFKPSKESAGLDALTCGVCGGTSLWLFGMGMHFIRPLDPPKPAFQAPEMRPAPMTSLFGKPAAWLYTSKASGGGSIVDWRPPDQMALRRDDWTWEPLYRASPVRRENT